MGCETAYSRFNERRDFSVWKEIVPVMLVSPQGFAFLTRHCAHSVPTGRQLLIQSCDGGATWSIGEYIDTARQETISYDTQKVVA